MSQGSFGPFGPFGPRSPDEDDWPECPDGVPVIPAWHSGLRIQRCYSCDVGRRSGSDLIPWPTNFHIPQVLV